MWGAGAIHLDNNLAVRAFRDQQLISEDITVEGGTWIDCRGLQHVSSPYRHGMAQPVFDRRCIYRV